MTRISINSNFYSNREYCLRNINSTIELINKYKDGVENVKDAIHVLYKIKISFQTLKKKDITKKQLKNLIKVLEKVSVRNSLTEEEKMYHHFMAKYCNDLLEKSKV